MQDITDEIAIKMLKFALAANDIKYNFWDKDSVEYAQSYYLRRSGNIPSVDAIAEYIGYERSLILLQDIVNWRSFIQTLKAKDDPCHFCGNNDNLAYFEFGLMRVESSTRIWGETAASIALSAITLPFLGLGRVSLPGKQRTGELFRLNLVICRSCINKNSNLIGLFFPKKAHYSKHPYWAALHEAGFAEFLTKEDCDNDYQYFIRL
jgi:hypothetical protein